MYDVCLGEHHDQVDQDAALAQGDEARCHQGPGPVCQSGGPVLQRLRREKHALARAGQKNETKMKQNEAK